MRTFNVVVEGDPDMTNSELQSRFQETIPVFLVNDIVSTMQWYSATLGFARQKQSDEDARV